MGMLNAANTALGAGGVAGVFAVDNTTDIIFTYASDGAVSGTISTLDYASDRHNLMLAEQAPHRLQQLVQLEVLLS